MVGDHPHPGGREIGEDDLRTFFGGKAKYYLREKRVIEASGSRISWNWPAFLFTCFWMIYRKMWPAGAIVFVLTFVFHVSIIFSWLNVIVMLVAGMYANAMYVAHAKKKVIEIALSGESAAATEEMLIEAGRPSWTAAIVAAVFYIVAAVAAVLFLEVLLGTMLSGWFLWELLCTPEMQRMLDVDVCAR